MKEEEKLVFGATVKTNQEERVDIREAYTSVLREHLRCTGEAGLQRAYELGRKAIEEGIGLLQMCMIYHQALSEILPDASDPDGQNEKIMAVRDFFAESLAPFEMAHRGFQEATFALRHLNERLEEEVKRIAHDLHDEVGQLLATVYVSLDEIAADLPAENRGRFRQVKQFLDQIEDHLRRISHQLRPSILDDLGLLPALEFLADGVSKRTGLSIEAKGSTKGRPPAPVETALYRIAQEGLNNISKHAQATRVRIRVAERQGVLRCSIQDNGVGFDVQAVLQKKGERGLGLVGIRERVSALGGSLEIISSRGQGTELIITIPVKR